MEETRKTAPGAAYGAILAAAALWGLIGVWNRKLMAAGLSPGTIVAVRNFGGMALLCALFAVRDRSVFRVKPAHLKYFFGTGVISVVLFTVCYFSCQQICSLAVASILLYTAPAIVVALSALLWKEPITKKKLLALALTILGCACVCGIFDRGLTVTVWTFLFAGPVSLLLVKPAELASMTPELWLTAACLAVFSTTAPYILYTWGLARVEAGRASIMASLEPVVAALVGAAVFGEPITFLTAAGIACVLAGVSILR